jgi:hypothetical protein
MTTAEQRQQPITLTPAEIQELLARVSFDRYTRQADVEAPAGPRSNLVKPVQEQPAAPAAGVYPIVPTTVVPYAGSGVAPVQQVLLPDGRVVTGYAMTPAAPVPQAAPVQRGGIDPTAQKLAGAGVLAVGVGYGGSLLLSAIAAAEAGLIALAVCLIAVWLMSGRRGGGAGSVRVDVRVSPTFTTTNRVTNR